MAIDEFGDPRMARFVDVVAIGLVFGDHDVLERLEETFFVIRKVDGGDARDGAGAHFHGKLMHGGDVEIELPGLFRVNALMLGEEDLLKRFALGQFVKGDEKLAVGALRKGFDPIFAAFFLEEAETVVAFEEIEETLDFGGGEIGDADELRREILGDGAAVGAPVGIALRADNDERQLP